MALTKTLSTNSFRRNGTSKSKLDSSAFQALLEGQGLKFTYERKHIYEEVSKLKGHFDADSLYDRFKKKGLSY